MATPLRSSPVLIMRWAPWGWRARGPGCHVVGMPAFYRPGTGGPFRVLPRVVALAQRPQADIELGHVDLAPGEAVAELLLGRVAQGRSAPADRPHDERDHGHRDEHHAEQRDPGDRREHAVEVRDVHGPDPTRWLRADDHHVAREVRDPLHPPGV